jgi:hypothetical protein
MTGRSPRPQLWSSGRRLHPPSAMQASHCANVTSYFPRAKTWLITTGCFGTSRNRPPDSAGRRSHHELPRRDHDQRRTFCAIAEDCSRRCRRLFRRRSGFARPCSSDRRTPRQADRQGHDENQGRGAAEGCVLHDVLTSGAERTNHRARIDCRDSQQSSRRTFGYTTSLFPIPERRHTHANEEGELRLGLPEILPDQAYVLRFEVERPRRSPRTSPDCPRLSDAGDQVVEVPVFH